MYVEVTDHYRSVFNSGRLPLIINGGGFGKVIGITEEKDPIDGTPIPQFEIEWADGTVTVMAQSNLKQSNRKAFFNARLGNV